MNRLFPLMSFIVCLAYLGSSTARTEDTTNWTFEDLVIQNGQELHWTSPTFIDPTFSAYDYNFEITYADAGFFGANFINLLPEDVRKAEGTQGGPLPINIIEETINESGHFLLDDYSIHADAAVWIDSEGYGRMDVTNVNMSPVNTAQISGVWTTSCGGPSNPPPKVIPGVPNYKWNYGCAPTSGGMLIGYWDNKPGYTNLVDGGLPDSGYPHNEEVDVNGGTRKWEDFGDVDDVIASYHHVRDYWKPSASPLDPAGPGHLNNCVADFMQSNKFPFGDNSTPAWFQAIGLRDYALWDDPTTPFNWESATFESSTLWLPGTFDFLSTIRREVDLGHPLILNGILAGNPTQGHSIVVYGYKYDDQGNTWIAVRDTWSNGDQNGFGIQAESDNENEWWKWEYGIGFGFCPTCITTFAPSDENTTEAFLVDSFTRQDTQNYGFGYDVDSGSGNGLAEIIDCPILPGNSVLKLYNPDPDIVAVETSICAREVLDILFDYLFGQHGKLQVKLDDAVVFTLVCPDVGPGSIGSDEFGTFAERVTLADFGLDPNADHMLRLELTSDTDPLVYLDNLIVSNPNAVPEPATLSLLVVGGLAFLRRKCYKE